jgi:hypothetical protein
MCQDHCQGQYWCHHGKYSPIIAPSSDTSYTQQVRLWYANLDYQLRLGQLVTIWTPHISNGEHSNLASNPAPLFTSIFPERDRSCHFLIHQNSDNGEQCKIPLGYHKAQPLSRLMTLDNFFNGGYDVAESQVLVCVKSIGAKKRGRLPAFISASWSL